MCFTLDPRMVQLSHVQEHQEEAVWLVLEDRCQELIVEDHTELASSAFVAPRVQTSTAPTKQLLGCTKLAKMMAPSGSVTHKVAVDATRHRRFNVTKNTRAPTHLKWWATRWVGGNNTDTIFQHSPGSRVVSWLSPRLLVLLNVYQSSEFEKKIGAPHQKTVDLITKTVDLIADFTKRVARGFLNFYKSEINDLDG